MRKILVILCAFGGAFWAPLFASGHGTEFLLARLSFSPTGSAVLEITADWENNPLLNDREHALQVLPDSLHLIIDGKPTTLREIGPLAFEDRTALDPTCPLPPEAFEAGPNHRLLTARVEWTPRGKTVQFQVPKQSKLDVLLWMIDPEQLNAPPAWMMLLGGDITRQITVPEQNQARRIPALSMLTLLAALTALFFWRKWLLRHPQIPDFTS